MTNIGPRVRSVSMNSAVGSVYNDAHPPTILRGSALSACYLDGSYTDTVRSKWWRTFNKLGNIKNPSDIWVILDENPYCINDPYFAMQMGQPDANGNPSSTLFIDTPASYHNGACGVAFADGHAEIHKWLGGTIKITVQKYGYPADDSLQDLRWLQTRTTTTLP